MRGLHFKILLATVRGEADQVKSRIGGALAQAPFWNELRFLQVHSKLRKVTPAAFRKAIQNGDSQGWKLFADDNDYELVCFSFSQNGRTLWIDLLLHEEAWRQHSDDTIEWLPQFLATLGHPKVLPVSGVRPDFEPPLPEPPHPRFSATYLAADNVIDIVDERVIGIYPQWEADAKITRMLSASLDGFRREVKEGYTLIRFVEDLTDERQLAEGRARHRQWLTRVIVPD
jgi:hypothetical protein